MWSQGTLVLKMGKKITKGPNLGKVATPLPSWGFQVLNTGRKSEMARI